MYCKIIYIKVHYTILSWISILIMSNYYIFAGMLCGQKGQFANEIAIWNMYFLYELESTQSWSISLLWNWATFAWQCVLLWFIYYDFSFISICRSLRQKDKLIVFRCASCWRYAWGDMVMDYPLLHQLACLETINYCESLLFKHFSYVYV